MWSLTLGCGSSALLLPLKLGAVAVAVPEDALPPKIFPKEKELAPSLLSSAFITNDRGLSCCLRDDFATLGLGRVKAGPMKEDQAEPGTAFQQIAKAINKPFNDELVTILIWKYIKVPRYYAQNSDTSDQRISNR